MQDREKQQLLTFLYLEPSPFDFSAWKNNIKLITTVITAVKWAQQHLSVQSGGSLRKSLWFDHSRLSSHSCPRPWNEITPFARHPRSQDWAGRSHEQWCWGSERTPPSAQRHTGRREITRVMVLWKPLCAEPPGSNCDHRQRGGWGGAGGLVLVSVCVLLCVCWGVSHQPDTHRQVSGLEDREGLMLGWRINKWTPQGHKPPHPPLSQRPKSWQQ